MADQPPHASGEPRLRRARTLVLTFAGGAAIGHNFLLRTSAPLGTMSLDLLTLHEDWLESGQMLASLAGRAPPDRLLAEASRLAGIGFLLAEGTPAAAEDQRYEDHWTWGPVAGANHFGFKGVTFAPPVQVATYLSEKADVAPQPPSSLPNEGLRTTQLDNDFPDTGVFQTMRRRRSYRGFADDPLPLSALRDCLYSAFAIVAFADVPAPGYGRLPLTMTPSGGARNPFEAYVVVRSVEGLEPGVYHYGGLDNTLGLLRRAPVPPIGELVGAQPWFDAAGAAIFLVANFERTAYKYPHPLSYRVVLLEAGHSAQNMLLAATANGLAAAPTAAITDAVVEPLLGLDRVRQAALYVVAVGVSSDRPSEMDLPDVMPNPSLST